MPRLVTNNRGFSYMGVFGIESYKSNVGGTTTNLLVNLEELASMGRRRTSRSCDFRIILTHFYFCPLKAKLFICVNTGTQALIWPLAKA